MTDTQLALCEPVLTVGLEALVLGFTLTEPEPAMMLTPPATRIDVDVFGMFGTCPCDNTVETGGFAPCDLAGTEIDPTEEAGWTDLYVCNECLRIIRADGLIVSAVFDGIRAYTDGDGKFVTIPVD